MRCLRCLFAVLLVGWLLVLAGCGADWIAQRGDLPEGGAGGSSATIGEGGAPACAGECREWKLGWFEEPSMFWIGPSEDAPPCPDVAPLVGSVGYAEPNAPHTCPVCSCLPAGCAMPEEMHVSAAACSGDGAPAITWDSPGWEGGCTAGGAIAPGLQCGGVPCTQSLTIAAPTLKQCQAVAEGDELKADLSWGLMAQECLIGPLTGEGCETGEACIAPPPEGFSLCVHRDGDDPAFQCPETYPRRHVVYAGYQDDRGCEPCACSDPQGGACSALVSMFTDGACGALLGSFPVSTALDEWCFDLSPGVGLGSKAAAWVEQTPGSCAQSGGPMGGIVLSGPVTLCCEPEREPVP